MSGGAGLALASLALPGKVLAVRRRARCGLAGLLPRREVSTTLVLTRPCTYRHSSYSPSMDSPRPRILLPDLAQVLYLPVMFLFATGGRSTVAPSPARSQSPIHGGALPCPERVRYRNIPMVFMTGRAWALGVCARLEAEGERLSSILSLVEPALNSRAE